MLALAYNQPIRNNRKYFLDHIEKEDNEDNGDDSGDTFQSDNAIGPTGDKYPSWHTCSEHPDMGWSVNDPLALHYYPTLIPDPTTATYHPITAPYVTFSILPYKAEVSATYDRDYPILTCSLAPISVKYTCLPITPDQRALLMQPPFDKAITTVVKSHLPITLDATLKHYKYFQERKYCAQAKIQKLQDCLAWACDNENWASEKVVCELSDMENANFLGRLFCHEDEILHHLSSRPRNADTFLCHALNFEGPIIQSELDPTPNPHCGAPTFLNPPCLPTKYQLHVATAAQAMCIIQSNCPGHVCKTPNRSCCFKCKKHGHVV